MAKPNVTSKSTKRPAVAKVTLDFDADMTDLSQRSEADADNRFARAREITSEIPNGLAKAPVRSVEQPRAEPSEAKSLTVPVGRKFDPSTCVIGMIYPVPIGLVDPNPDGARVFYKTAEVDRLTESLQKNGQDDAAVGFVENGRVVLINGGTRWRSAKSGGLDELDIRIVAKPADRRALYLESARRNDESSDHTILDTAFRMTALLKEGVYASQDDAGNDLKLRNGQKMTKSQVSMVFRIGKIPEQLLRKMADHEQTCMLTIAYEISAFFAQPDSADREAELENMASDVIDEVQLKRLSKTQTAALVQSKLVGPRTRQRAISSGISFAGARGVIKVFPSRGQLDLNMKGLTAEKCDELKLLIEKACSSQAEQSS